jgi:beta-lactamase class A
VSDALAAMVELSDTTTGNAFLHLFTHERVDETLAGLGLTATSVNTYDLPTTAADMALLMEAIATGRGLSPDTTAYLQSLLRAQTWRSGIPAGLPDGVTVGNKTGNVEGVTHDVAFVEGPAGVYVIAVLSDRSWEWDAHAAVSAAVYAFFQGQRQRE